MYNLIRNTGTRRALVSEGPSLLVSFAIAEAFYKFHSFSLECGAFLLTWLVVSYGASALETFVSRERAASARKMAERGRP